MRDGTKKGCGADYQTATALVMKPKNRQKNRNFQPGPEKQHSYIYICVDFTQGACTESLDSQVQGETTHPPHP